MDDLSPIRGAGERQFGAHDVEALILIVMQPKWYKWQIYYILIDAKAFIRHVADDDSIFLRG